LATRTVTAAPQAGPETTTSESASDAKPAPAKEAEGHFQRARQLFDEGDYSLALVEFQRAYDISPNYRVLYNIAQVDIQLFHYAAARVALEKFIEDGGSDIPAQRKAQAERDLKMLAERTAYVRVTTNVPAEVAIDDQSPMPAPFADYVLVNAGQRKVTIGHAGYAPVTRQLTLAGGDRKDVNVELVPVVDTTKSIVVLPSPAPAATHSNYTPAIVGWVATGTLALATGVVGGLYLNRQSEIDRRSDPSIPISRQDALHMSDGADRLAIAADLLGLAAIGAGVVSLYFTLRPPTSDARPPSAGAVRLRPSVGGLAGSF
jgi:hypothetical protein